MAKRKAVVKQRFSLREAKQMILDSDDDVSAGDQSEDMETESDSTQSAYP